MGAPHLQNDKLSNWLEVIAAREVLRHTRALSKILNVGEDQGEDAQKHLTEALHEDTTALPDLTLLHKNQKPIDPETGLPKTRPLCLASVTFN